MTKLGWAGDRFGDYLFVNGTNFPCAALVDAINLQTQNSPPNLAPKFRRLLMRLFVVQYVIQWSKKYSNCVL